MFQKPYFGRLKGVKQGGNHERKRNFISRKLIWLKYKKERTPWERGCIIAMKNLTNTLKL